MPIDKVKIAKNASKLIIGIVGSAAIGSLWKVEKIASASIDSFFENKFTSN